MVSLLEDKRVRISSELSMLIKDVPKAELRVCLGYSRITPGAFDFLLENKAVLPRAVVEIVSVHPFGWPLHVVHRAALVPPL